MSERAPGTASGNWMIAGAVVGALIIAAVAVGGILVLSLDDEEFAPIGPDGITLTDPAGDTGSVPHATPGSHDLAGLEVREADTDVIAEVRFHETSFDPSSSFASVEFEVDGGECGTSDVVAYSFSNGDYVQGPATGTAPAQGLRFYGTGSCGEAGTFEPIEGAVVSAQENGFRIVIPLSLLRGAVPTQARVVVTQFLEPGSTSAIVDEVP